MIFTTQARGPGAEMKIGERLVLVSDGVIARLENYRIGERAGRTPQLP